ncbi:DEAD/DEAH box helicase, partial [Patescibacteria group bacterium]|nr:DEAD/DEAH box helicase [Patescibacteria group bacterium]
KVLSLFFIDKVANYRNYQDGEVLQGKFAEWFEEICNNFKENPKYKGLLSNDIDKIHNGYFSQDKKGLLKDTKGNTKVDDDTYALIMKHKEKLLSLDEPLRFIFSHSALREGWDNPNVFQICTLNESHSEMKKRQEIGRGLRLPVNQEGIRIFDENINVLTVIANESYEDFAKTLQTEIEEDCGVNFTGRIKNKAKKKKVHLKKSYALDENFKELWDKIKHKTRYQVEYNTEELIEKCAQELENVEIKEVKLQNTKVSLNLTREKVDSHLKSFKEKDISIYNFRIPNILENIQNKTNLTKNTILRIIKESGKIEGVFKNPQQFIDIFSLKINLVLNKMMIDGIKYERIVGDSWEMKSFENDELEGYIDNMYQVQNQEKTLYNYIICDSDIENKFAQDLESNEDVKFYIKLPYWFKIETPIGSYNPDWAVVFDGDKKIYFVVESKGKNETENLRDSEKLKIKCGEKHFEEFEDVEFKGPVKDVISLLS